MNTPFFFLLVLVVFTPIPVGLNRLGVWLPVAGFYYGLLSWSILTVVSGRTLIPKTFQQKSVLFVLGLYLSVLIWIGFQTIPITPGLLQLLSVQAVETYTATDLSARAAGDMHYYSVSLDRGMSYDALIQSGAYFCYYLLLILHVNSRSRLRIFCYAIVFSGLLQATYGSYIYLSGVDNLISDIIDKYDATGTFINRNHFAGYLEMTLAVGIGLMLQPNKATEVRAASGGGRALLRSCLQLLLSEKAIIRLTLIIMVIGLILSHSRMGNAAFFNSLIAAGILSLILSPRFRKPVFVLFIASVLLLDVILLGSFFDLDIVIDRLTHSNLLEERRDEVNLYSLPMLKDFARVGSGAGTFYYVFPGYAQSTVTLGTDHAHNDYFELLTDFGLIGLLCLSGIVLVCLWEAIKALGDQKSGLKRGIGFASFMGVFSILLHSSVDFNLHIPANALLFITMLALPQIASSVTTRTSS